MLSDISEITGKKYRNIVLHDVLNRETPFWRDSDVFDLQNAWTARRETYYEYEMEAERLEYYDPGRFFVMGTSFSLGLKHDISALYPYEKVERIVTNQNITYTVDNMRSYLDGCDVVVLEIVEHDLYRQSNIAPLDVLLETLETYTPQSIADQYVPLWDVASHDDRLQASSQGIYFDVPGRPMWTKKSCKVTLANQEIPITGLEIGIRFVDRIFHDGIVFDVYCNGWRIYSRRYTEAWEGVIEIPPEEIKAKEDNIYEIELYTDGSFIPKDLGINNDGRELSMSLSYIKSRRTITAENDNEVDHSIQQPYSSSEPILFTEDAPGTAYFASGISGIETDFAWSLGKAGRLALALDENDIGIDLDAEFNFKMIYNAPQRLIVRSGDEELFNEVITSPDEPVRFRIPAACTESGTLTLDLEYPDAVSPESLGRSTDARVLAFAFQRICFKSVE